MDNTTSPEGLGTFVIAPKVYINSFPKSGTHLAVMIIQHIVRPNLPSVWCGSFSGNSWTTNWIPTEKIKSGLSLQQEGTFMLGHMGYKKEILDFFMENKVLPLFIYRDLRDVVVSQTYHVKHPNNEKFVHPNKELYKGMSHEEIMLSTITGIDKYPGVIERWELYAKWLDIPWILKLKYSDMCNKTGEVIKKILDYILEYELKGVDFIPVIFTESLEKTIEKGIELRHETHKSASFREGVTGRWKEEFTPKVKDTFKKHDNGWLVRLGYEENNNW